MKKLAIILLSLTSLFGFIPNQAGASTLTTSFSDVPQSHWAYHDIKFLSEKEVIKGFGGKFLPNKTITRLDAAVMMGRAMKLPVLDKPVLVPTDMNPSTRGYQEVVSAVNKGMFTLTAKKFQPNEPLTRKEMAKALAVGFGYDGKNQSTFSDIQKTNPFYKYVDAIAANNITTGYADGTFRPELAVNRLQFSVFLSRIYSKPLKYIVKQDGEILHTVRNAEEAINLALNYPKATVHPVSNTLVTYSEEPGTLEGTGIRNGTLIYNGAENTAVFTPEFFKPYLTSDDGTSTLFDTYIILGRSYPGGEFGFHAKNNSNYSDWWWYMNQTFAEEGVLNNLNESAKNVNKTANVYISIPYPKMTGEFIDIDGKVYPNTIEERQRLVSWYMDQVETLWRLVDYSNLEFKGYYWMSETMGHPQDEILVTKISEEIHKKGMAFIYSPHATSTNFDRWKNYGFDGAYLQPNAFRLKLSDTPARLHRAFLNAQIYGSGINIEIDQYGPHQIDEGVGNFKQYIDMAHRYNLPGHSLIFYQGIGMVDRMVKYSDQPSYYQAYQLLSSLAYKAEPNVEQ